MIEFLDVAAPASIGNNINPLLATILCTIPVIIIIVVIIINKKKISKQGNNLKHNKKNN